MLLVIHWNNGDWFAFNNIPFSMKASEKILTISYKNFVRHAKMKELPVIDHAAVLHVYAVSNTWIEDEEQEEVKDDRS